MYLASIKFYTEQAPGNRISYMRNRLGAYNMVDKWKIWDSNPTHPRYELGALPAMLIFLTGEGGDVRIVGFKERRWKLEVAQSS